MKVENQKNVPQLAAPEMVEWGVDLGGILSDLLDAKWFIAKVTLLFTLLFALYALFSTPIYQADALIQVEEKSGSLSSSSISPLFATAIPIEAEREILRSRLVVRQVVDNLNLTIEVNPSYFPIFGGYSARKFNADEDREGLAEPWLWFDSFAWGGESLEINSLTVPRKLLSEELTLVAGVDGTFELFHKDDSLLSGHVGEVVERNGVSILVNQLIARDETEFTVLKKSWATAVEELLADKISISERGTGTDLLDLFVVDKDPQMALNITNILASFYVRQNVERTAEEAQKQLDFLEGYMPKFKAEMENSSTYLNAYMSANNTINLSQEAQSLLDMSVDNQKQVLSLELQLEEMRLKYNESHLAIVNLKNQLSILGKQRKSLEARVAKLPAIQQDLVALERDSKVNEQQYIYLLTKIQDLNVLRAGSVGNVRVVDAAYLPEKPIKPEKAMLVILGFFSGLFLSVIWLLVKNSLHQGVEDYAKLERDLGIPTYAVVPHAKEQRGLDAWIKRRKSSKGEFDLHESLLAESQPKHVTVESLRGLRTSLHFQLSSSANNIVMITGSSPGVGKSFISSNFADVLSKSGQRVLLIDADLRKGHLEGCFGFSREPGLSDVLVGKASFEQAVHDMTEVEGLSFLSTGTLPPNPSELLMSQAFTDFLDTSSEKYDLVLIDTPPILAATDAAIIGERAGIVFMVIRASVNTTREIEQALASFQHTGVRVDGFIFNDMKPKSSVQGYGQYGYHYHYEYEK
jgi:tyrosine-protein kinase Etk/Wzc